MAAEIIHECTHLIQGHHPRVYADQRNNVWVAWIEFLPTAGGAPRRTGEETSQATRDEVVYWPRGWSRYSSKGRLARAR